MSGDVTLLLDRYRNGDRSALDQLMPLLYGELRKLAHRFLDREREGHTLQTTSLVHEAYLKLSRGRPPETSTRAHFLGVAAHVMRQILVDHARSRGREKRNWGGIVPLEDGRAVAVQDTAVVLALDDALVDLTRVAPRRAQLLEMSYFGGLTAEESAEALSLSVHVVRRELRLGQAWLRRELTGGEPHAGRL